MADDSTTSAVPASASASEPVVGSTSAEGDATALDGPTEAEKPTVDVVDKPRDGAAEANGHTESKEPSDSTNEPTKADNSVMNDVGGSAIQEQDRAEAVGNGTVVANKATSNGLSKKRSSIIPEHRSKKLNKKKSKPVLRLNVEPGQLYLARLKGHQPWPSIVCDEEMLPQSLLTSRPVTTAQADGTFKKPEYASGGKRESERTYPIMFLQTNEFAWIPNTELTPLAASECADVVEKGKSKALLLAYGVAAEDHDLDYFKDLLAEHENALKEDLEAKAEREAKKASKSKRKSTNAATTDDDADEMEVDEEDGSSKPKSKKRKKSLDSDAADDKPAKTPKTTGVKLKLSTPKTPAADASTKKKPAKAKSASKKSAAKADDTDEDMDDAPRAEEKPLTPAEAKEKKEKEIRYYRHKLQKGFLSRDTVPADDEIKSMSSFLTKLETYPDLEGSIIRATKIHKVLKAMLRLSTIPKDDEFQFKQRSRDLLQTWSKILSEDLSAAAGDKDGDDDEPKFKSAATNGTIETAETEEGIAPEEKPAEVEKKINTTIKSEKEVGKADESIAPTTDELMSTDEVKTDEPDVAKAPKEEFQSHAETVEATA